MLCSCVQCLSVLCRLACILSLCVVKVYVCLCDLQCDVFCTAIYHPLVDPMTSQLNLRAKFQTWNPSIQSEDIKCPIRDVLLYLKNVLHETNYWDNRTFCFHKDAFNAYVQWKRHLELLKHEQSTDSTELNSEEFLKSIKQCVYASIETMYQPIASCNRFGIQLDGRKREYEVTIFETIKNFKKDDNLQAIVNEIKIEAAGVLQER